MQKRECGETVAGSGAKRRNINRPLKAVRTGRGLPGIRPQVLQRSQEALHENTHSAQQRFVVSHLARIFQK